MINMYLGNRKIFGKSVHHNIILLKYQNLSHKKIMKAEIKHQVKPLKYIRSKWKGTSM